MARSSSDVGEEGVALDAQLLPMSLLPDLFTRNESVSA
jgi:hypothetical protein